MSREFYRSALNGDVGHLVFRDGKQYIRVNRPGDDVLRVFKPDQWIKEAEHRPLSIAQVAAVAFEADRALCRSIGLHGEAQQQWLNLPERKRIAWMQNGPPTDQGPRRSLYEHVIAALAPLMDGG